MSRGNEASRSKRLKASGGADLLTHLPKVVMDRIMSFLPSDDVVRTMLLARAWGNKWKEACSIRITNASNYPGPNELNRFVNMFLLFSNPEPLFLVEINSSPCSRHAGAFPGDYDEPTRYLELWMRHCLERQAKILKIHNCFSNGRWKLNPRLLSSENCSKNLRVLDLQHAKMKGVLNSMNIRCLDFSSCLVLEDIMMINCEFKARLIVSPSVKRLTLKCCSFGWDTRSRISVQKLVFLVLASCSGRTPILYKMPCLVSAFVRLQDDTDVCDNYYEIGGCNSNSCMGCRRCVIGRNTSVLLEAMSGATHLELTAMQDEFIFRKDLTQCPLFSMLKTLLLNEWCVTLRLDALRCFLQHCPILEKLTIQFPRRHVRSDNILRDIENNGAIYNMAKELIPLKHLEVEVISPEENVLDIIICEILQLLDSFRVPPEQIKIKQPPQLPKLETKYLMDYNDSGEPWPSARFSFE